MNYKKVIEDFNNGTLDPKKVQLVMDNDEGYWAALGLDDEDAEDLEMILEDKYGLPGGYEDVVDILRAAGVNAEWC
jgi:hypothetical protein